MFRPVRFCLATTVWASIGIACSFSRPEAVQTFVGLGLIGLAILGAGYRLATPATA